MEQDVYYGGPMDGSAAEAVDSTATLRLDPASGSWYARTPTLDTEGKRAWVHRRADDPAVALTFVEAVPAPGAKTLTLQEVRNLVTAADSTDLPANSQVHVEVTFRGLAKKLTIRPPEG